MKFYLNGIEKEFSGDENLSLLTYLREIENITSVKDGCSGQGTCGACSVEINGKSSLSCATPMKKIEGAEIVTVEGIEEYKQRVFANAFVVKGGVQCGFCTPGIVMNAKILLENNPNPTRDEIAKAINRNLCRCTGYKKIIDSIEYAAEAIRSGEEIPAPKKIGKVGKREPKYKAEEYVLGKAPFVDDLRIDNMLYGAFRYGDHPRAKVLRIDTKKAEALEGVKAVFTAKDIPGERMVGLIVKDWPMMIDEGEITHYIGDVLAVVVAEDIKIARQARELIEVEYKVLEPVTTTEKALEPDAPKLHPKGNLLDVTEIERGDIAAARRNSAYISRGVYQTQMIEHAYLEPESAVALPEEDGVLVYSQGQGIYEDRKEIARVLSLPEEKVHVILVPNGGGFGGKEDLTVQHHSALAAYKLQQPVKITLTREESIRMSIKRHPIKLEYELGCDAEGKLTFLEADIVGDTGAYASVGMKVLERAAGHATGGYMVPNVKLTAKTVYTNNLPCGAMRGFGANQATFAMESAVEDLCVQGGFDRWEFRYNNALKNGDTTSTGQILKAAVGVRETLLAVKDIFNNAKYAGIACGIKNTGIGNGMPDDSTVKIQIVSEDRVVLYHGWTEMGQGVNTMALQFFCEETGIDPNIVEVKTDTKSEAAAGMTTASRATSLVGNSIREACIKLKEDLKTKSLAELTGKLYSGTWVCDWTTKPGADVPEVITHYSYSYAAQVVILNESGEIEKIVAAHDAGKIINPTLFEGQIEGSVHMGLGYAISEELVLEGGIPKSFNLRKLGILRAKETPEIEVIGVEVPDPHGPHGAKGVGEIGLVPTAGAVANAFYRFDGVRYYKLPIKQRKRA